MSSDLDSASEDTFSLDKLKKWKVTELKDWLTKRGLKKSGNKPVLINRVYRAWTNSQDSDIDSVSEGSDIESDIVIPPLHSLSEHWKIVQHFYVLRI